MRGTFRESAQSKQRATRPGAQRLLAFAHQSINSALTRLVDAPLPVQGAALCLAAAGTTGLLVSAYRASRSAIRQEANPLEALAKPGELPSETMYRLDQAEARRKAQR